MRTLCAAVLTFESIIVLLAIPVAIVVYGITAPIGIIGGGALMVVVFAIMWFYAIRVGRQGDAIKAARQAQQSAT